MFAMLFIFRGPTLYPPPLLIYYSQLTHPQETVAGNRRGLHVSGKSVASEFREQHS